MKLAEKIAAVVLMDLSCVMCWSNLYDNSHIIRFITVTICMSFLFVYALVRRKRFLLPSKLVSGLYISLILLFLLSIAWSVNLGESVFAFSKKIIMLFVTLVAYNYIANNKENALKTLWISGAIIVTVYVIVAFVQISGIEDFSIGQLYNVSGINGHKNLFSSILLMISGFMFAVVFKWDNKIVKAISVTYFSVATILVIILKSRAALFGLLVAVIVFLIIYIAHKRNAACSFKARTSVFCVLVLITYLSFTFILRLTTHYSIPVANEKNEIEKSFLRTSSLSERFLVWGKSYNIVDKHPMNGCGIGNWKIAFPDAGLKGLYRADVWNITFIYPHNEFIETLSEGGYIIFLLFIVLLCFIVTSSFFIIVQLEDKREFFFGAVILAIFVGYHANAIFDFPSVRIEHIVWKGVITAFLFYFISQKSVSFKISSKWSFLFLSVSIAMVVLGFVRMRGERNTCYMQGYMRLKNWREVEKYSDKAVSRFYTIDPIGVPIHWYKGKAQSLMGNTQSVSSYRLAYKNAPFCKENLNDLGLGEYFVKNNVEKAEFYLKEAVRISPNFLNPYFNLATIYIREKRISEAKEIIDAIDMNEYKREILTKDVIFFEQNVIENTKQKINMEYETTLMFRHIIDSITNMNNRNE